MTMTPGLRRLALTAHVTCSVGWLGAVVAFLPVALAAMTTEDAQTVRGAYVAMDLIGSFVLVPAAFASLITGLVMSLGTKWGLLRHYWVLVKFVIAIVATTILLGYMQSLRYLAGLAAEGASSSADLGMLRDPSHVVHASAALLALLVAATLSLYKPQGMTRYGLRKQQETRVAPDSDVDGDAESARQSTTKTPGWVKVFSAIAITLVVLVVVGQLTGVMGRHGAGSHGPSRHFGGHQRPGGGH